MSEKEKDNFGYWRSLEELAGSPEYEKFASGEFLDIADDKDSSLPRRNFLKIMGASMALATASGCRFPVEKIVPFSGAPMNRAPGEPVFYATGMELGGVANGLLAKSFDGRPIKLEGNPEHPFNMGATNAIIQASILELYDPDRAKHPVKFSGARETAATWDDFAKEIKSALKKSSGGKGVFVLSESSCSSTGARLKYEFAKKYPKAKWLEYEPFSRENEMTGIKAATGKAAFPARDISRAEVIVCLDADILGTHPEAIKYIRDFADGRTGDNGKMNRLYVAEPGFSLTGAAADHRIAVPAREIGLFALEIMRRFAAAHGEKSIEKSIAEQIGNAIDKDLSAMAKMIADDLIAHQGKSIVVAGESQPQEVHALVCALNALLGGTSVQYPPANDVSSNTDAIKKLVREMKKGNVKSLFIIGGNPVFDAPADLGFASALENVAKKFHLSLFKNETSVQCDWLLPRSHYLESWGDMYSGYGAGGVITFTQPLIRPLYETRSVIEFIHLAVSGEDVSGREIMRKGEQCFSYDGKDEECSSDVLMKQGLDKGLLTSLIPEGYRKGDKYFDIAPIPTYEEIIDLASSIDVSAATADGLEIVFKPCSKIYDGRFANNAWLQELPDPITKITWDNAALMSPATAKKLGVKRDDVVKLTFKKRSVELPVFVLPGHADDSVSVTLGYGRTVCGRVGTGVGANVNSLRTSDAMWFGSGLEVEATGRRHELACTQDHQSVKPNGDKEREKRSDIFVREADLDHFIAEPDFARHKEHHPPLKSLWKELSFDGHRWGLAIDLSRCVGCGACMTACQAENNVPVVGRGQVVKGREMNWIRIDRYFKGDPASPTMSFQPVPCQQCEMAPCEHVCPVAANVHTKEGLNDMVYNRCIGMRFCSNNCPYKVRRFNYFRTHQGYDEIQQMVFNPDVTVRPRGVMEKCTYCVQRIQDVKIKKKNAGEKIKDGDIVPACAQACPARAIVFGDYADPDSRLNRMADDRSYAILEGYNLKPRTIYQARLKNPAAKKKNEGEHEHS